MQPPPFQVRLELAGWCLFWAHLAIDPPMPAERERRESMSAALRREAEERARAAIDPSRLPEQPAVGAVRALFRAAGCDPTRYRPSSEALLRRVLRGEALPAVHPLVDLNNCLSLDLAVPSCIVAQGSFDPPVTLRAGCSGEAYESLRGPFHLEGKPLLADLQGPFGTPITDSQRVKVHADTHAAWLVAYLPASILAPEQALDGLTLLLAHSTLARLDIAAASIP